MACCKRFFVQKTPLLCGVITPNQDGVSPNSNRKYQTCRSTQITGCCVLLQLKLGSHKHDMKAENVLGYYCNLDSLRYVTSTASCLKTLWENTLFLLTEALFNHAVKLHSHWFVQCVKNEPMARQRSCTSLWRQSPPEWSEPSGYISDLGSKHTSNQSESYTVIKTLPPGSSELFTPISE